MHVNAIRLLIDKPKKDNAVASTGILRKWRYILVKRKRVGEVRISATGMSESEISETVAMISHIELCVVNRISISQEADHWLKNRCRPHVFEKLGQIGLSGDHDCSNDRVYINSERLVFWEEIGGVTQACVSIQSISPGDSSKRFQLNGAKSKNTGKFLWINNLDYKVVVCIRKCGKGHDIVMSLPMAITLARFMYDKRDITRKLLDTYTSILATPQLSRASKNAVMDSLDFSRKVATHAVRRGEVDAAERLAKIDHAIEEVNRIPVKAESKPVKAKRKGAK